MHYLQPTFELQVTVKSFFLFSSLKKKSPQTMKIIWKKNWQSIFRKQVRNETRSFTTSSDAKFGYKVKTWPYERLVQTLKYISSRKRRRKKWDWEKCFLQNCFIALKCVTVGYYSQNTFWQRSSRLLSYFPSSWKSLAVDKKLRNMFLEYSIEAT